MASTIPSHIPEDFWKVLTRGSELRVYNQGEVLFQAGAPVAGVFLVQSGQVILQLDAKRKKKNILEHAGPGAILALGEAVCGEPYRLTAQAATPAEIYFVSRPYLLEFLRTTPLACMQVLQLLSGDLRGLYQTLRQGTSRGTPSP